MTTTNKDGLREKSIKIFPDKSDIERIRQMQKYLLESVTGSITVQDDKKSEKEALSVAIKKANLKKVITVKEFQLLYDYSEGAQKGFRNRLNDPLPYIQKSFGCKIQYRKKDIDDWLGSQK